MILKTIQLENIRSYIGEKIDFPTGSLMLSGDVGAGKSTILLAVEFALFGLLRGQLSGESLLRNGTSQGSVLLKMNVQGKDVIIKRCLKRSKQSIGQDTGYIIVNGEKTEATPTELKVKILELLGYPQDQLTKSKLIYRYTVYTPQEEMKQILNDEKEMRLDTLRKVFGVDRYKRIDENIHNHIRHLKVEKRILLEKASHLPSRRNECAEKIQEREELERKEGDLEPKIIDVKHLIDNKKEDIDRIEKHIVEREEIVKQIALKNLRLQEKTGQFQKNKGSQTRLEDEISGLREKISSISTKDLKIPKEFAGKEEEIIEKELAAEEKEVQHISEQQVKMTERLKHLKQGLDEMQAEIRKKTGLTAGLQKRKAQFEELKTAVKDIGSLKKDMEKTEQDLQTTLGKIKELETLNNASQKLMNDISMLKQCPTCRQEVSQMHKESIRDGEAKKLQTKNDLLELLLKKKKCFDDRRLDLKGLIENTHSKEKELERLRIELTVLDDTNKEVVAMQRRFSELGMEQIELETEKTGFEETDIVERKSRIEENKTLLKEIKEHNFRLREKAHIDNALADKEKEIARVKEENVMLKDDIKEINSTKIMLNQRLTEFDKVKDDYETAKGELEKLTTQERKLEIAIAEVKKEIEGVRKILLMIDGSITEMILAESKLERLNSLIDWLDTHFIRLISNMEKHVMLRAYNEFNDTFARWFDMLIEDDTISVRLDEQFSPLVIQNGYETEVANLSGGEKTSVALAYRLALNKVVNDVVGDIKTKDLIILDEPTDGFSSYQLDRIKDVIEQLGIKQTLIVSHESKIESFVDNVLHVNKDEHVSKVL